MGSQAVSDADLPRLESRDLEDELRPFLEAKRTRHLFAVYGTGDGQTLRFGGSADMLVVPVRSELELRSLLPPIEEESPRRVFLVPWTSDVPLDLAGRFARDGRVIRIGRESRLKRLFGVGEVDLDAQKSPLADWLLRPSSSRRYSVREGRLTHELLWSSWLHEELGVDTEGGFALDALLAWAAVDGRSRAFTEGAGTVPGLRDALLHVLERSLGPAGPVAWRAWEQGHGGLLLEYAVLLEALAPSKDPAVRMWVKQRLRAKLGVVDEPALVEVPVALGRSAGAALRYLERRTDAAKVRAIVRQAEEHVDDDEIRAALVSSTRLPGALDARLGALGEALGSAAAAPSAENVAHAERLLHAVEGHALAAEGDGARHVERGWMAARLLAWLVARPDARLSPGPTPYDAVETVGQWYADEGGYVDWARRSARGSEASAFGRGVQAVVRVADRVRQELDRTFARALVAWTAAGQPAHQVVPIDRALERVASKFLEERDDHRLLVLLLDGMAWAQAVELLDSLSQQAWGPLAWHTTKKGPIGGGMYPVVLAAVPSVTEISRAAFFASKPVPPGRAEDTQKDRERFRENKIMGKFFTGTDEPTLLLRAEGHTKSGAASEEALRLVADPDRRVVALVLNAIDDALKGNPATRHPWGVKNIASLADLLEKARDCGRAVLLASDHGHVPSDLLEFKGTPAGGGARWRPLASSTDPVGDYEVAFPAGRAWAPRGAWGVALMADDTGRWGSSTHAGDHGGATLAEVIAPCVLVGAEDLQGPLTDEALGVRAPYVPGWWHLAVQTPVPIPPDVVPTSPEPVLVRPGQLALPVVGVSAAPATPPPPRPSTPPASLFARSKVLEARAPDAIFRKDVARAVEFLLVRNGVAKAAAFAAEMSVLQRRVGGLVAKLQEILNVDGYEVLRFDAVAQDVSLDVGKLRLLFEVPA
jgi:PglZ domain